MTWREARSVPHLRDWGAAGAALDAFNRELTAVRNEGLTRALSSNEVECLFALGFALEQLHQHVLDLVRCVQVCARPRASVKPLK
jgi:hypothetical protein